VAASSEKLRELVFKGGDVRAFDELPLLPALADNLFPLRNHPRAESCDSRHGVAFPSVSLREILRGFTVDTLPRGFCPDLFSN
jgi:hypothetical protein